MICNLNCAAASSARDADTSLAPSAEVEALVDGDRRLQPARAVIFAGAGEILDLDAELRVDPEA